MVGRTPWQPLNSLACRFLSSHRPGAAWPAPCSVLTSLTACAADLAPGWRPQRFSCPAARGDRGAAACPLPQDALAAVVVPVEGRAAPRLMHQADQALNPASVMKLVTTYAALDLLGPAFTWDTPVYLGHNARGWAAARQRLHPGPG